MDNNDFATATIVKANALDAIKNLKDNSIDLIITDPPYFIDGMGTDWNKQSLETKVAKAGVVGSMPTGMKFDPKQGVRFEALMSEISIEAMRVLKPGGFFLSFSQARLYHRAAIAMENAGFEIRDMIGWKYEGQAKAFSMDHFIRKMQIPEAEKKAILEKLGGRKTPQLKPQIEPVVLAQKPKEGTFVENWMTYGTGLMDTSASLDGKFPGNIIEVKKPTKLERGEGNDHLTVKPVALIQHLITLFSTPGQTILDPFNGSGTTGVACLRSNRNYIGFEIEQAYIDISLRRIDSCQNTN